MHGGGVPSLSRLPLSAHRRAFTLPAPQAALNPPALPVTTPPPRTPVMSHLPPPPLTDTHRVLLFLAVLVEEGHSQLSPGAEPPPLVPHRRELSRHGEEAAAAQQGRERQEQDVPARPLLAGGLVLIRPRTKSAAERCFRRA